MSEEQYGCTGLDEVTAATEANGFARYEACSDGIGNYEGTSRGTPGAKRVTKYLGNVVVGKMLINKVRIPEGFIEAEHIGSKLKLNTCQVCGDTIFLTGCLTETINYATSVPPMPPMIGEEGDVVAELQGQFHGKLQCSGRPRVRMVKNRTILIDIPVEMSMKVDFLEGVRLRRSRRERVFYNENTLQSCGRGFVGVSPCQSFAEDFVVLNKGFKCDVEGYRVSQVEISKRFETSPCGICGGAGVGEAADSALGGGGTFCNKYFIIEEKMLLEVMVSIYMDDVEFDDDSNCREEHQCPFHNDESNVRDNEEIIWNPRLDEDAFMTKSGFIR